MREPVEALTALSRALDWPEPPDQMPQEVRARLTRVASPVSPAWRFAFVGAATLVVFIALVALSPLAREAVAGLFEMAGVQIFQVGDEGPAPGGDLELGESIPMDDLSARAGFVVRAPSITELGPPDGAYLAEGGLLSLVWRGSGPLPSAGDIDIGLLLTQSPSNEGPGFARKDLPKGTDADPVSVGGDPGVWIEDAGHTFTLLGPDGIPIEETARLAANVLLWEHEGVRYRLETAAGLSRALEIAESLEPTQ